MSITIGSGITLGAGITAAATGFTISSADFVNYYNGGYITSASNLGFTTTTGSVGPGYEFFGPRLGSDNSGSDAKITEIKAYFDANSLNTGGSNSYMFNVTWGAGSTFGSGVAVAEFFYHSPTSADFLFGAVDTSNPAWQTSGSNYYNGPPYSLVGTFNFPVTFSVITPLIVNGNNWC